MPRPKTTKENFSISIDPKAMKALQEIADRKYFGNRSVACEKAIWKFVSGEYVENPEGRELIYNDLINPSN